MLTEQLNAAFLFAEFCDVYEMESDFEDKVETKFNEMIDGCTKSLAEELN